jgi:hypothetical protein
MLKKFIKYFILSLLFTFSVNLTKAKKVPGYIITENSDTIYGQIKLSKFDLLAGTWIIFGINIKQLHFEVCFRENKGRKFRNFQAINISGFGFNFKSEDYIFKSFTLKSNTAIVKERERERFLQLIYKGEIELYRDQKRTESNINPGNNSYNINKNLLFTYYDLFLYNESKGLTKVEISKDIKTINQLLDKYDLDKEYIKIIPSNTKLKDIGVVLINYDLWKKTSEK